MVKQATTRIKYAPPTDRRGAALLVQRYVDGRWKTVEIVERDYSVGFAEQAEKIANGGCCIWVGDILYC